MDLPVCAIVAFFIFTFLQFRCLFRYQFIFSFLFHLYISDGVSEGGVVKVVDWVEGCYVVSDSNTDGFSHCPFHLTHQSNCTYMFLLAHSSYLIGAFVIRRDCGDPVRRFEAHPRAVYGAVGAQGCWFWWDLYKHHFLQRYREFAVLVIYFQLNSS